MELDEALRLYELNKDSELTVHGKVDDFDKFVLYLFQHNLVCHGFEPLQTKE